jgi:glycosyltransferase involved in cell wall biosynthesis
MKVALDVRWLRKGRHDGIGRVVLSLVPALVQDRSVEWILLYDDQASLEALETRFGSASARSICVPFPILTAADFVKLPRLLRKLDVDAYLTFNYPTSPWHSGYRRWAVVHDLIQFRYRQGTQNGRAALKLFYATKLPTRLILSRLDGIIAPSQNTAHDLRRLFGVPETRVSVVQWATDRVAALPEEELRTELLAYDLAKGYVLYVGRYETYKNVSSLIEAHRSLDQALREAHPLVLVGALPPEMNAAISGDPDIRSLGAVESVEAIYAGAALFVFPSTHEGFGFPPLEAMARRTPVITTSFGSIPEVVGDAAIQTNGTPVELCAAMQKVLTDPELRLTLIAAGADRASRFSWERAAAQTVASIRQER